VEVYLELDRGVVQFSIELIPGQAQWSKTALWMGRNSSVEPKTVVSFCAALRREGSWLGRHPLLGKNICRRGMMAGSSRHHRGNVLNSAGSGEFPAGGPSACTNSRRKICRGFFDAYCDRSRDLLILRAGRRLTEVPPPLVAKAEQLGRDAGKAATSRVPGGNTPKGEYQRVLSGTAGGDPAVPGAAEPPAIGPGAGYDQDDLARDLGIEPGDRALPRAVSAYASAFRQETKRAAATTPAKTRARHAPAKAEPRGKE
jgi:hypothetical protein